MKRDAAFVKALALGTGAAALGLGVWLGLTWALLSSTLSPAELTTARDLLGPRVALLFMMVAVAVAAVAAAVQAFYRRHVAPPARLLEQARVLVDTDAKLQLQGQGTAAMQGLAAAFNALVAQREQLRAEMGSRVAEASRGIEQERSRLAALMAELTQSVVVCNLDGRVLLYNQRARLQFKALSSEPGVAGGAELMGLGRSIHTVLDPALLDHALDNIRQRLERGAASPAAQFVTVTRGGQLLRVQMAAVRDLANAAPDAGPVLGGYVLVLDNITRDYERDSAQDQLLQDLTEGSRAALGNLQAAVELLATPDLDDAQRERFLTVVRDEARQMAARLNDAAARSTQQSRSRWPLEDMLGSDLVAAALARISAATGQRASALEVEAALWLKLDSYALLQALTHLAGRLFEDFEVPAVQLRLQRAGPRAQLDLVWPSLPMSTETVMAWESEGMRQPGDSRELSSLSVHDVVQRHGGEFWFERDRSHQQQFFRFLLPLAESAAGGDAEAPALAASDSRPEFYDFNLFGTSESTRALDEQPLASLRFTVFDTETTGLAPQQGDEIIQIGAVRVVGGRLLQHESFEQLVDPQRSIPAAGIPIHGITPEMVQGKPTITRVLPAFHAFAADTVLVAHNAAFDMRFLQLKEEATGLRFDQPVLDTLLLSAVVHPQQESHRLEAIAERFGVTVVGRHTALGDARVTAEVFLHLLPLLAAQGIHTLGQAREAAQKTYYARLSY